MFCASMATSTALPPAAPPPVGPFDVVASRYGVQCQGCDELALTLLDVLDYMEQIPVVARYQLADGSVTDVFPMGKTLTTPARWWRRCRAGTATSPPCAGSRICPRPRRTTWLTSRRPWAARSSTSRSARSATPASCAERGGLLARACPQAPHRQLNQTAFPPGQGLCRTRRVSLAAGAASVHFYRFASGDKGVIVS